MLGLGVDYSLFILTRAYGELEEGRTPEEAMERSLATAGCAVLVAGITIGTKLLTTRIGDPVGMNEPASTGLFAWLARTVTRRPVIVAVPAVGVMLILASPVRDLQTGWVGDDADPPDMTRKQAYGILAFGLGPGVNGELIVTAETGTVDSDNAQDLVGDALTLRDAVANTPGVQAVSPPLPDNTDAPTAFVGAMPVFMAAVLGGAFLLLLLVSAIVFRLSMDDEVCLVSRMEEEHAITGDAAPVGATSDA